MRIDPNHSLNIPPPHNKAAGRQPTERGGATQLGDPQQTNTTGDLGALAELLRATPDDRASLLKDVRTRISSGELLSRETAENLAESILKLSTDN